MKFVWLTDNHFYLELPSHRRPFVQYVETVAAERPDAVLLGGDLCCHASLRFLLTTFSEIVRAPLFLTLGNHEFFGMSVGAVTSQVTEYVRKKAGVVWLTGAREPVWLSDEIALIGADSWGDAQVGNLSPRNIRRRTHQLMYDQITDIKDLKDACGSDTVCIARAVQAFLGARGKEVAAHLDLVGRMAALSARKVWILMHAPPFLEATLFRGKPDYNGLPFYCAFAAGEAISALAESFPHVEFTVLAGHTHHAADIKVLPNLRVLVHDPISQRVNSRWAVLWA